MVPDIQEAGDSAAEAEANDEGEESRLGRWWQHFLDVVEFVLDLF